MAVNLRQEARRRECQIRIPGVCNKDPETVVLAHSNRKVLFGAGIGMKVPDIFGAWACSRCHDRVDGRSIDPRGVAYFDSQIETMHMEGIFRTQKILLDEGKIGVI